MTFWEHLDELRKVIFRSLGVIMVLMVVIFLFKDFVFNNIILAPLSNDFFLFRWMNSFLSLIGIKRLGDYSLQLVNIDLAAQFFTHIKISFYLSLVLSAPLIIYFIWDFVRPALYPKEKTAIRSAFGFSAILFYVGVIVGYATVFPLTVRFLGTYQVSELVPNQISLLSYISMFISLILIMGIVFEMPVLAAILSKIGIINKQLLKKYRKHAIVVLLILAAAITPSGDAFTLLIVALPLYLLYELSILVCKNSKPEEEVEKA